MNLSLGHQRAQHLQGQQTNCACANHKHLLARLRDPAQHRVERDGSRFKQNRLLVLDLIWNAEQLLLMKQHLFAPAAANLPGAWQIRILTESIIAIVQGRQGGCTPMLRQLGPLCSTTRSPTCRFCTYSPISMTSPTTSCPG